jgi:hypothetical protein
MLLPAFLALGLDCFVTYAPRNDDIQAPPLAATALFFVIASGSEAIQRPPF